MYSEAKKDNIVHLPLESLSKKDRKIVEIAHKQQSYIDILQKKANLNNIQVRYYNHNKNKFGVGNCSKFNNNNRRRQYDKMSYKGFDFKNITNEGKIELSFN